MKAVAFFKHHLIGILTLVLVSVGVRYAIAKYKKPGSMTVIEAQAMDMSASGTPVGSVPVAVEKAVMSDFAPTVTYTGSVVALNENEVYPRVTGMLTAVLVYPGDRVRAGQIVAKLDSAELASRTEEADAMRRATMHEAMSSSDDQRQAAAQKRVVEAKAAGTRNALLDAKANMETARAMREQSLRERDAAQASLADAQANVGAAQADADYWKAEIAREERLFQAKAVSRDEYEREKSQAQGVVAKLTQAKAGVREKLAMVASARAKIRQSESGIVSAQAKVDQVQADVQGAKAEVDAADVMINALAHHIAHREAVAAQAKAQTRTAEIVQGYTEIRAPGPGVVTERLVSPGTLVQPGMAILRIKSMDRVRLQANVAESDLASIHAGSAVTVTSPRDPKLHLQTRITSVFTAANPQSRTVTVEALVSNSGGQFAPGQYIVMAIATATPRRAITVPLDAVGRDENGRAFVWTVEAGRQDGKTIYACVMHPEVQSDHPGKCYKCGMELQPKQKGGKQVAHRAEITLGTDDGKRTIVATGLGEGEEVIVRGFENLKEGDPVTPSVWDRNGPRVLPAPSGAMPEMPGMKHEDAPKDSMPDMPGMPGMEKHTRLPNPPTLFPGSLVPRREGKTSPPAPLLRKERGDSGANASASAPPPQIESRKAEAQAGVAPTLAVVGVKAKVASIRAGGDSPARLLPLPCERSERTREGGRGVRQGVAS